MNSIGTGTAQLLQGIYTRKPVFIRRFNAYMYCKQPQHFLMGGGGVITFGRYMYLVPTSLLLPPCPTWCMDGVYTECDNPWPINTLLISPPPPT